MHLSSVLYKSVFSSTDWKPAELMSWHGFHCPSVSLFLVYAIKPTFLVWFLWNLQSFHLINSFNSIDFENNLQLSKGKVAIFCWKFEFLVYMMQSAFVVRFSWNLHSLSISQTAWMLLILKKNCTISKGKEAILSLKFAFLVYAIHSVFVVRFLQNLHSLSISSTFF